MHPSSTREVLALGLVPEVDYGEDTIADEEPMAVTVIHSVTPELCKLGRN